MLQNLAFLSTRLCQIISAIHFELSLDATPVQHSTRYITLALDSVTFLPDSVYQVQYLCRTQGFNDMFFHNTRLQRCEGWLRHSTRRSTSAAHEALAVCSFPGTRLYYRIVLPLKLDLVQYLCSTRLYQCNVCDMLCDECKTSAAQGLSSILFTTQGFWGLTCI